MTDGQAIFEQYLSVFNDKSLPEKFQKLTELYFEFNAKINISAIREVGAVYIKHYLDSIYPYSYFNGECCDVGCGGGFPSIPLALVTGLPFTAIDGVGKKLNFIHEMNAALGLNITPIHIRAEDLAKTPRRFDTVCARAVADTDKVLSYCAPLTKLGGKIILYKTPSDPASTQSALKKTHTELIKTEDYTLTNTDINRRLYIYKKI